MHTSVVQPAQWLLFTLVGLPQFSETVYSPSLPDIAQALKTSVSMVEYTLTIYLFAFSLGMLCWGKISDAWGRKPSMLAGIAIYLVGCIGCYFSSSITLLLASRFVQAFGGSAGSVIGQAMCRDVFQGKALSRVYAAMATALGVPPAIGPAVGGFIAERFGWTYVFLLLIVVAAFVMALVVVRLPETLSDQERRSFSLISILWRLLKDKRVMAYAWCIGCVNGIMFSYFSEGPFYLIKTLGLSPIWYGRSFIVIAVAMMAGGRLASYLHGKYDVDVVLQRGAFMMIGATGFFAFVAVMNAVWAVPASVMIGVTLVAHMISMAGRCLVNSSALSIALADYRWCSGTASSVFGFIYYLIVSLITFGIGLLHNGTLYVMPLYFLVVCLSMVPVAHVSRERNAEAHG